MDKNGKLFGKINLIDLLVLVVALAAAILVGMKLTGRGGNGGESSAPTEILYTAKVSGVDREVYENVKAFVETAKAAGAEGDQLLAGGELLGAYVVDVNATERGEKLELVVDNYSLELADDRERVDVTFTIKGQVADATITELGTQEIRVGKSHIVKTTHFELTGAIITSCQWTGGTSADRVLAAN